MNATSFTQLYPITDLCFLVSDVERAIAFYVGKLGFKLRPVSYTHLTLPTNREV